MNQLAPSASFPGSQASPTFLALAAARTAADAAEQLHWEREHNGAGRAELGVLAAAADAAQAELYAAATVHRMAVEVWRCRQSEAHRSASRSHNRRECPVYQEQEAARAAELAQATATVTGSRQVTVRYETVQPDGTVSLDAQATYVHHTDELIARSHRWLKSNGHI